MRLQVHGHGHSKAKIKPVVNLNPGTDRTVMLKRRWRLGDVIMCEPVSRIIASQGADIVFCTRNEYHPIIHSFVGKPPKVMSYPPPNESSIHLSDEVIDLDVVTLDHPGYVMKVDAFLAASGIDHEAIPMEEKAPVLDLHPRYDAWAKMKLESLGILDEPLIAIVRQGYDDRSPRLVPPKTIDTIAEKLSKNTHVLYIGAMPVKVPLINDRLHNFTGATPDVTFAGGLLKHCRLIITIDTGLMHLAGALGTPAVTMMGPTRPDDLAVIYPRNSILDVGRECSPCFDRGCDDRCLNSVDADMVVQMALWRMEHSDAPTFVTKI